jgi:tetratricopeptide (TPR) repeat protein
MKKYIASALMFLLSASAFGAEDPYQRMSKLYQAKQFKKLEQVCQARLKEKSKSLDAHYFLILMRLDQGKGDKAVPYMIAFEKYHNEAEAAEAKKSGAEYILIDSYYGNLYYILGQYHVRRQEYDKAFPWLSKAKSEYSNDPMLYFFLGRCYVGQGKFEEGMKAFQNELKLDPKEPSPLYNIACCYGMQGKEGEAVEWLKKAIQAYPPYKKEALKDENFKKINGSKAFKALTAG